MSKGANELSSDGPWVRRFQRLLAARKTNAALGLLDRVIENDYPLFDSDSEIVNDRRVAWLYRIDLLRETGRLTEALAWACLECELHPDNAAAHVVMEELKRQAWLHKVESHQQAGRLAEALAWACLECELHPDNSAALAVKEKLKQRTRLGKSSPAESSESDQAGIVRWQGLAGMRQLRAELEQDVIAPLLDPDLYRRYRIPLPNGILLYGPPGCGKTFIAKKLAEIIGFKFFDISPADLGSVYVHGGQKLIRKLFDQAESEAPAMIFFDEFDALVPARDGHSGHHYESEVNELLTQLNECATRKILVVAATNRAEKIDAAVLRPGRFDKHFFVGIPDIEARVELFRLYLTDRPTARIDYLKLGNTSEGYTPAEIREIVNEAARSALSKRQPISQHDLLRAIESRRPTLKPEDVVRRRIGFQGNA